ncbi:MAG: hypothetical protein R3F43_01390 [bacterium]
MDLDAAVEQQPDVPEIRIARAAVQTARGEIAEAQLDLDAASPWASPDLAAAGARRA